MNTILIIDDDPVMRGNIHDILELEGFHPLVAEEGKSGLLLARKEAPHLILCDVLMPELDGYGVLEELRSSPATARIPFIFLTAKGEQADVRAGMNLGADDYLIKPVKADDLLDAVAARLERAGQQASFNADFSSAAPLEKLGLSPREAEILLWVAQGKTNFETSVILAITVSTVKKHLENIFAKLGVESRNAATLKAIETLHHRA